MCCSALFFFEPVYPAKHWMSPSPPVRFFTPTKTLDELWAVLVRPKFDRYLPLGDRLTLLRGFEQISVRHHVNTHVTLCRDPKDDKFLSLVRSAQAICITSGDLDLLVLGDTFDCPIFSPADFLLRYSIA